MNYELSSMGRRWIATYVEEAIHGVEKERSCERSTTMAMGHPNRLSLIHPSRYMNACLSPRFKLSTKYYENVCDYSSDRELAFVC